MNKIWQKKPSLAVALLLLLVAIATLQSVLATNHAQQQVTFTTTETTTVTIKANSSEVQPLSQYGVVRIQTTALNTGRTLYVQLNSTVGPIYLEQLQIVLRSPQSQDIVAAGVTLGGLSGPTCSGTIIKAGQLYGAFDFSTCTNPLEITDPAGNLAIAASAGTSNALSMQPIANAASSINGQVIVTATLCVPITATVTLTAMLQ
ncbi:MAG: hypothetical protein ABSC50_09530 [Candidatus Bathyarchaeia archaeon]